MVRYLTLILLLFATTAHAEIQYNGDAVSAVKRYEDAAWSDVAPSIYLDGSWLAMMSYNSTTLGNNLIWAEYFKGDLSAWSTSGTVSIATSDHQTWMTLAAGATSERDFAVSASDDWIIEFDYAFNTSYDGLIEILNAADDTLISITFDGSAGNVIFDTDLASSSSRNDGNHMQRVILTYDHSTHYVCAFMTANEIIRDPMKIIGSAKEITPATTYTIKYTAPANATNRVQRNIIYKSQMMALGASITQGIGSGWNNLVLEWPQRTDYSAPWTYQLAQEYDDCYIMNLAFGGSEAAEAETYISSWMGIKPTRVYICYGHNDILWGTTVSAMEASWNNLLTAIQNAGITGNNIIVANIPASSFLSSDENTAKRIEFNTWVEGRATAIGALFLDLYTTTVDPVNDRFLNPSYDCGDGVHWNKTGQTAVTQAIYDLIEGD